MLNTVAPSSSPPSSLTPATSTTAPPKFVLSSLVVWWWWCVLYLGDLSSHVCVSFEGESFSKPFISLSLSSSLTPYNTQIRSESPSHRILPSELRFSRRLGSDDISCVYLTELNDGSLSVMFAAKVMDKKELASRSKEGRAKTEREILESLNHPLRHHQHPQMPEDRAIQVEDSMVERQPSMDVRHPRNRDFNVIEIKLLDFSDDCSGSGNNTVMDASLEGESMAGNKRNVLSSSAELNEVMSKDQFEDVKKAENSSLERSLRRGITLF